MENKEKIEQRRGFLKKAAYAVPAVIALGQITNPIKSSAASYVGGGKEVPNPAGNPATGSDKGDARNIFKTRP